MQAPQLGPTKRALLVVAIALLAFGQFGCAASASQRCTEYEREVQALLDRCGIVRTFHIVDPATSLPICSRVSRVQMYEEVPRVCYPFLRSAECITIDPADPLATFPPECGGFHFQFTTT